MDRCCDLDVHKDSVFSCIPDEQGNKILEKRYGTLPPELDKLRATLIEYGCGRVAMNESACETGKLAEESILIFIPSFW
jgi:hypothetical protein